MKAIITDLDGTLTKGSLVLEHCGHLEAKGIINTNGAFENWNKERKNEKLIIECSIAYQSELIGLSLKELDIENFVSEFLENEKNWYDTIVELEGRESFIISGSADFLVQELVKQLNQIEQYEQVKGFGSIYEIKENVLTGKIEVPMFSAEAKKQKLKDLRMHLDYEIIAIGDTYSDKSLFDYGDYNILVEPTFETLEKLILDGVRIHKIIRA